MTTIDHRILIPAGPEAVWEYVSDITHNPDWQIDCAEVIFLTSRREGPGVRWRYSAPSGHECVIAVTAWYNGLGYEYYFVDGVPYKENKGRIRLQEIPEGTIVQWTFTYEIGGLLGGMRNSLGVSRSVDFTISESLKTLYQKIKASGAAARPHESKSLMRDAPNVDARSAYQPRHPSVIDDDERAPARPAPKAPSRAPEPPVREGDGQRIRVVAEPPVAEDDTRRRKAAAAAQPLLEDAIPPDIEGEPDFLKQLVDLSRFEPPRAPAPAVEAKPAPEPEPEFLKRIEEPPISKSDTQPRKPVMLEEEAAPPVEEAVPVVPPPSVSPFEPPPSVEDTEPVVLPAAAPPPAVSEEPTEPAVQVPDETQADYAIPARIYEWPRRETAEPTLTQAPDAAPPPPPRETEPEAAPPPPEVAAQMTPVLAELHVVEATPEATPPVSAPAAQVEAKPESSAPAAQVEPTPASLQAKPASETASIWEVFGIPRPSESDAAPTPTAAPSAQPEAPAPAAQIQPESAPVEPQPAAEVKPAAEGASIWEISDAQRPGETEPPAAAASAVPTAPDADTAPVAAAPQEVASEVPPAVPQAAVDLPVDAAATAERIALPPAPTRAGLRLALRRRLVDVRRP